MVAELSATPSAHPARVSTPPPPAIAVCQPNAAARNPWAAPAPAATFIAAGDCNNCMRHIKHICLHSSRENSLSARSERLSTSPRPPSAVRVVQWPKEQPNGAVDRWVAAQSRQNENASEGDGGLNQLFQDGAGAGGALLNYAASATSTVQCCQGQSLQKALKN